MKNGKINVLQMNVPTHDFDCTSWRTFRKSTRVAQNLLAEHSIQACHPRSLSRGQGVLLPFLRAFDHGTCSSEVFEVGESRCVGSQVVRRQRKDGFCFLGKGLSVLKQWLSPVSTAKGYLHTNSLPKTSWSYSLDIFRPQNDGGVPSTSTNFLY